MNKQTMQMEVVVVLAMVGVGVASAAESPGLPPTATEKAELDRLAGQPVDIAPWEYVWRAERCNVRDRSERHETGPRAGRK